MTNVFSGRKGRSMLLRLPTRHSGGWVRQLSARTPHPGAPTRGRSSMGSWSRPLTQVRRLSNRCRYWVFALDHMKADPAIAPDWASLSASLRKRRDLKSELDQWTALRLRETIGATFGSGFVPGRGYMLPPPATRFYDPNATLGHLRGPVDVGSFTFQSQPYSAGPEGPSGTRDSISYGPNVLIGTTETGLLEVGKYRTMYLGLRNDPLFRIKLASVEDLDEEVAKATARFASAAFQYFERVRGSKSLLGTCALCPKFED